MTVEAIQGERFGFGRNWQNFLESLDDGKIERAENSLRKLTGKDDFRGLTFLDIGSGSGLFSLAARRLGASVTSFDYDPDSVAATQRLKDSRARDDAQWAVMRGDVLDEAFLRTLGIYDVVYSWGVLHHTGAMWEALGRAAGKVAPGGVLCIALYNDEGFFSDLWALIKKLYNRLPRTVQPAMVVAVGGLMEMKSALGRLLRGKNPLPRWKERNAESLRGMTVWHDYVDWIGGYPFEVARPDEVFRFFRDRGFSLRDMTCVGRGHGCNEFVFVRN